MLPSNFYKYEPLEWQEKFMEIFIQHERGIAHAEQGCGKTFAAIHAWRYLCNKNKHFYNTLIWVDDRRNICWAH